MPVRSSISMRISLSSCSLKPCSGPWRSLMVIPLLPLDGKGAEVHRLTNSANRCQAMVSVLCRSAFGIGAELGEGFIELVRKLNELADGGYRAARALRGLARDVGNDLHGVGNTFCAAHLLFGRERNLLDELSGLANDAGDGIESPTGLIGKSGAGFDFLGAVFHDHNGFVRLRLNGFDERGDVLGGAAGVFGKLANFIGNDGEPAASFTGASSFDGGVEGKEVGLLGDVVNHVDDLGDFQGAIAERLNFLGGGLHGRANALHAIEGVADGAVALFSGVEGTASGFGAGFGVVGNLLHGDGEFFDGAGGVGDFLVLLGGAGLHFVGGDKNVVGAGGDFHGGLADALEDLGEIVEHIVDGIGDVAEGIVGDLAAEGQVTASDLVDDGEEIGDAALQ